MRRQRARAEDAAEERVLDILVPPPRSSGSEFGLTAAPAAPPAESTARQVMRKRLREGELDDKEIEVELADAKPALEIMGPPGMEEMAEQLKGMFSSLGQQRRKARKVKIAEALRLLAEEEAGKLVNEEELRAAARRQRRAERHRLHRRDRQGRLARRGRRRHRRGVAPGRAARPAAAGRGHRR